MSKKSKLFKIAICLSAAVASSLFVSCSNSANDQVKYVQNEKITLSFSFGQRDGVYTGNLLNELPDGVGKFVSKNESGEKWTYIGEWSNGHFNGNGTSWYENGSISSLTYDKDTASGYGINLTSDGTVFYGDWVDDNLNGTGTYLSLSEGYKGEFVNGIFSGTGTFYSSTGCQIKGMFADNFLSKDNDATIIYPDGGKAIGTFYADNSGTHGTGTYYSTDGKSSKCILQNGNIRIAQSEKEVEQKKSEKTEQKNTKKEKLKKDEKSKKASKLKFGGELITNSTVNYMKKYDYIQDVYIEVKEDEAEINIVVQVPTSIDFDTAKMAGEDTARYLASLAAYANNYYVTPGGDSIGSLYDTYSLLLYVDDGNKNFNIHGAKVPTAKDITWRD